MADPQREGLPDQQAGVGQPFDGFALVVLQMVGDDVRVERVDARTMTSQDWEKIANRMHTLTGLRISVDDRSAVTWTDIKAYARSLARKGPLAAVIVDYLQLMEAPTGDRRHRHELIASCSRGLKILAKEMGIQ